MWAPIWRWLALALSIGVCAGLNVYRATFWKTHGVHVPLGFDSIPDPSGSGSVGWARSYARIDVLNQRWRPLRLTLRLRAPAGAPEDATMVHVSADYVSVGAFRLGPSWSTHTLVVTGPPARDGTLSLQLETRSLPVAGSYGFGFGGLTSEPVLAAPAVAITALVGAVAGLFVWWALAPRRWPRATGETPERAVSFRRTLIVAGGLFLYFGSWALIRPPLQTGDEPQHLLRTTSVLLTPWVGDPGRFDIDPRFVNPLVAWEPRATSKLPFYPNEHVTTRELGEIKRIDWRSRDQIPPFPPLEKAIASYPTLYYFALFSIAEPLTSVLHLSPYQGTYAYRLVSSAFAAILWALVFVAIGKTSETASLAWPVLLLLVCNPMLAYLSSGVTADAVSNPLSALAILAFWHMLARGTHQRAMFGWLVAGALVKPAALQVMAALAAGGMAAWLLDRRVHLKPALLVLAQAGVVALGGFYLWSTPRFLGPGPSYDSLRDYLANRATAAGEMWIEYWGRLGWLDYQVDPIWYYLLLALVLLNVACVGWRPRRPVAFALFGLVTMLAFLASTLVGEFLYLPQAGYTLQGRYFLPVGLLFAALVSWHQVRSARAALIAGAVVLTALLAQRTVDRYYEDGWRGAREGLPFVALPLAPTNVGRTS